MKPLNMAALILVASLLISLLSGINQLAGFFSQISLATAILSGIIAIVVAVMFPMLLKRRQPSDKTILKMSFRTFSIVLAILIVFMGVGPFIGKYVMASQAKSQGLDSYNHHLYAPARVQLTRAVDYFDDLGFSRQAVNAKLVLLQVYADLGNRDRAIEMIDEIEAYADLSVYQQGKLYAIRGIIAHETGEYEQAKHFYELAYQAIEPDSQDNAILLQNHGVLLAEKGAPFRDQVIEKYQKAQNIYEKLNDEYGLACILISKGTLYENEPDTARSYYEEALKKAEAIENSHLTGVVYMNMGVTCRQQGDINQAEELYQKALLEFEKTADYIAQAEVLVNLATVEWVRGKKELARQHVLTSEAYLRNIDETSEQLYHRKIAQIRTFQADIYDSLGESETAEGYYQEALSIYSQHPHPLLEATTRVNYMGLLLRLGRAVEANNEIKRAREILEAYAEEGPNQTLGVLYSNLGKAHQDTGDFDNALRYYTMAVEIFDELGDTVQYAQARENQGIILTWLEYYYEGLEAILEAHEIYVELENKDLEVKALFNLYCFFTALDDPTASDILAEILYILDNYNIDQDIESGILFGILVQDIDEQAGIIIYRERLLQQRMFYEQRDESIGIGLCLRKLAEVEQGLHNWDRMEEYAREAALYADLIPIPQRVSYLNDLGFMLVIDNPEEGIDLLFRSFDVAQTVSIIQQQNIAFYINTYVGLSLDEIDHEKYISKCLIIIENTNDTEIKRLFQEVIDML